MALTSTESSLLSQIQALKLTIATATTASAAYAAAATKRGLEIQLTAIWAANAVSSEAAQIVQQDNLRRGQGLPNKDRR